MERLHITFIYISIILISTIIFRSIMLNYIKKERDKKLKNIEIDINKIKIVNGIIQKK